MKNNNTAPNRGITGDSGPSGPSATSGSDETIKSERIQIERKLFLFTLKENPRGRFLRITEDVGGRRDTIIIPATGLADFAKVIEAMAEAKNSNPEEARQP